VPRQTALLGVSLAALVMIATIPYFGALSDRIGRRKVYAIGSIITGLSSYFAFWLLNNSGGNPAILWIAIIIPFGIFYASVYAPEAALFCELFDARVRYSGISFVYQFSGIFASGITPIIATALLAQGGGQPWLICAYVMFAAVVSAICAMLMNPVPAGDVASAAKV
jgi:MHS family metabolite:H+ symporter-like MFS transporter